MIAFFTIWCLATGLAYHWLGLIGAAIAFFFPLIGFLCLRWWATRQEKLPAIKRNDARDRENIARRRKHIVRDGRRLRRVEGPSIVDQEVSYDPHHH